ncbi:hypothetical protein PU634_05220 [Oceanimonas pelagia]|uniref:Large polyvalent protein-associated domain-containing protein n=1 Tax=Oceanimonas pelagia TaxID=3028314 RepID=A0AA50QD33_9GAMM|nr:LPD1 domain-containing protein [Oceanimonas pelagia]WMC11769.1 hypothetical protein PU634_05220 [Oceanimonas pelagia]
MSIIFDNSNGEGAKQVLARLKLVTQLASTRKDLLALPAGVGSLAPRLALVREANRLRAELGELDGPALSDDPNSPHYRFRDTGEVSGSRKELAASAIRLAKSNGDAVKVTDIDWQAIEENPREAEELISKGNLFGETDWEQLQQGGMDPAAGFLVDKVFAAIGPKPAGDAAPQLRQDYAWGLQAIRARMQACTSVSDVREALEVIRDEMIGTNLNEQEAERYTALMQQRQQAADRNVAIRQAIDAAQTEMYQAGAELRQAQYKIESRGRRGWKPDPTLAEALADAQAAYSEAEARWSSALKDTKDERETLRATMLDTHNQAALIVAEARERNSRESQECRSWRSFGERFAKLVNYRRHGGSDAFRGHVTNAAAGKVNDWSWADKSKASQPKRATKREVGFQLQVADSFVRQGGREISVGSTAELKERMGFREVQSGNWVLNDPNSARFHVEQTAAAMVDMADVLGINEHHLGLGGRLAMAFGARGRGGKNAARAHYEPVQRVINLTKMGGGGALGHELLHALDNIIPSLVNETPGGKGEFASANPELLPEGPLRDAFAAFRRALTQGDKPLLEIIKLKPGDGNLARHNIDGRRGSRVADAIREAGNATDAVKAVRAIYGDRTDKRSRKTIADWVRLAAAYYHDGEEQVELETGPEVSDFMRSAQLLDAGSTGKYWSSVEEMAARAFQSYLEDKMSERGMRNDYLSALADNKHYSGGSSPVKPFPEGEERLRINAAIDELFDTLKRERVFEKAVANKALLDSIFDCNSGAAALQ